ncbi:hypothetical protein OV203_26050 [Nannocystis sp. ILAH1]|uniref:phage major capsid protein n=1 Tax=Nannocystis sp. ILAH1 TaxID=2996789 RepID=UPI002270B202|nr:hypothetical protein [Nannocystis sp. ILAH1]MCY0990633.1 hypothetical protein [Nannocystis sp. ILAH1]
MAVQPGFNSTQINDTIHSSGIARFVVPTPAATPLYAVLGMYHNCTSLGSNQLDIPSWGAFPATEETVEGDEVVSVNYNTDKKSIVGVMYSTRALITDQAIMDSTLLQSDMVAQMVRTVENTLDSECLSQFVTATNFSDNSGVNLTVALWQVALAAFRAQKPLGQVCFVGSNNQVRDLLKDFVTIAGGQQLGDAAAAVFGSGAVDGYRGPYAGVQIFESSNVNEFDASNDAGGFVAISGLNAGGPPQMSGLSMAMWEPLKAEGIYFPHRHGYDTTASSRCGFGRTAEYLVRGFYSKKAA